MIYIYTHTDRHAGMCVRPESAAPAGDSLTACLGIGDTTTDNKMDTNPKTSDTITQHRVTH